MIELRRGMAINQSVVCAELDDEMVLLNAETGLYFGLDPLGAEIWRHLSAGRDEDEITVAILGEYEVEPALLRDDLAAFLGQLADKGLIER